LIRPQEGFVKIANDLISTTPAGSLHAYPGRSNAQALLDSFG
jgi:hypothetical protein